MIIIIIIVIIIIQFYIFNIIKQENLLPGNALNFSRKLQQLNEHSFTVV